MLIIDISTIIVSNIIAMNIHPPSRTIFYVIERAIKTYRKFSQRNLSDAVTNMTIDQGMVLAFLDQYPDLTQKEIAAMAFRDNASMTRMINLMVQKNYITRSINTTNRRQNKLEITKKGHGILDTLAPVIQNNRATALQGISQEELNQLETILNKIIINCS